MLEPARHILSELQYATRRLRRSRGFFTVTTLLIAVAIAATTTIFGLVDALLLGSLPVRDPESLVQLFEIRPNIRPQELFPVELRNLIEAESTTLSDVVGELEITTSLEYMAYEADEAKTARVDVGLITDNYFEVLGVGPALGGGLTGGPQGGDSRVAVVSHLAWLRYFGGDETLDGRSIRLGGHPYRIVGVMPRGFHGTSLDSGPDLRVPYGNRDDFGDPVSSLQSAATRIIARLAPGASLQAAGEETEALWARHRSEVISGTGFVSAFDMDLSAELRSIAHGTSFVREQFRDALVVLFGGTLLLLGMVSLNVGGLLLARVAASRQEVALRLALGASRARIACHWAAESCLIAVSGGSLGLGLAASSLPALVGWLAPMVRFAGVGREPSLDVPLDFGIVAFALAATVGTGLAAAVVPALRSGSARLYDSLRAWAGDHRGRRVQWSLSVIQVALCTLLLVAGLLMVRTLRNLEAVDAGFDRDMLVRFSLDPTMADYDGAAARNLAERLLAETRRLPGVQAAALSTTPVMQGVGAVMIAAAPGRPVRDGAWNTNVNQVTPGYFDVMGIELLSGAVFAERRTTEEGPAPVVVNEAFADSFFDSEDPVGRVFDAGAVFEEPRYRIVGMVTDANYRSLRELDPPIFYMNPYSSDSFSPQGFSLMVRTATPEAVIEPVRAIVRSIDAGLPVLEAVTMSEEVERSLWRERLVSALAVAFAVFALALAGIGLYGILAQDVTSRLPEIGLRVALGAGWRDVLWVVSRWGLAVIVLGFLTGTAAHLFLGRWIESLLYGTWIMDPVAIVASGAFLLLVFLVAGAVPVTRAISLDPAVVLRRD